MGSVEKVRQLPSLLQITSGFSKRRVLVVGDLVADHYIYGQTDRVSREAPVLIVRFEQQEVKLGGGANAAANVRSLGAQVTAVGALGADEMGRALRRQFKACGIRLLAAGGEGVQTETKTRILAGGVSTTRQQMLRLDKGGAGPLPARVRLELNKLIREAAKDADAVLVSDYGAGVLNDDTRGALRKLARDGQTVCVDSRHALEGFAGVTVCKPNEPELAALTRLPVRTEAELLAAGKAALAQLGCELLLVTRGRNGMALFQRGGAAELIPVFGAQEAVDVTGAGDTVIAAFSLSLAAGASPLDAARIANVAGALVVQKQGTATVSRAELTRELTGA